MAAQSVDQDHGSVPIIGQSHDGAVLGSQQCEAKQGCARQIGAYIGVDGLHRARDSTPGSPYAAPEHIPD